MKPVNSMEFRINHIRNIHWWENVNKLKDITPLHFPILEEKDEESTT